MRYVIDVRKFVQIVSSTGGSRDSIFIADEPTSSNPSRDDCLGAFIEQTRCSEEYAEKILRIAIGEEYLSYPNQGHLHIFDEPRLSVTGKGEKFLTTTDFINTLAGSVGKITPIIAVAISIVAIIISLFALSKPS